MLIIFQAVFNKKSALESFQKEPLANIPSFGFTSLNRFSLRTKRRDDGLIKKNVQDESVEGWKAVWEVRERTRKNSERVCVR